jgi:hypothetical protein
MRMAYSSMFTSLHGQVRSAAYLEGKPPQTPEAKML